MPSPVWDEDKSSWAGAAAVAAVATANADATYGQPEADLINELKTTVNALRTAMISFGVLATD